MADAPPAVVHAAAQALIDEGVDDANVERIVGLVLDAARAASSALPDPAERPTLPLWPDGARPFGIGRTTAYRLAHANEFPVAVIKVGGKLMVPTAALRRALGLDPPAVAAGEAGP